ncbi:glycosyltransferase family 2 protein [Neobacillus notoginsengisoli]|uniref:Glycosyltransferase family 2 protein n=1 Tax=Neobacillus notoginsengisoli TaxID=1578198 RepID=A0A417YYG1_9BACI|nr:glycosyltransferase family 2 protein [Neobacillus notoginsengisoli]RHW42799.1 glycosyltransferase family 2 protein [Neobacillus notoginsengisoli]
MSTNVLVSIILPIYNSEKYLVHTIESVLNQSHKEIEVILVDDGSIDNSLQICKQYESSDNRVKVYKKENGGVSAARNFGLNMAGGKYIRFVDSDDLLPEESTSKLVEAAEQQNAQVVIGGFEERKYLKKSKVILERFNGGEEVFSSEEFATKYLMLKRNKVINAPWNKLYCRTFLEEKNILFDAGMTLGEDLLFNLSCFRESEKIITILDIVYIYMVRPGQGLSQKYYENKFELVSKLLESEMEFTKIFGVNIKEYVITNKINECIYHIESIIGNQNIPFSKKKKLIKQETELWGLGKNFENVKISRYNTILLRFLVSNNLYGVIFLNKVKVILKTLNY